MKRLAAFAACCGAESCIAWNDPAIGFHWPYEGQPQVSAKDALGMGLGGAEVFG